MNISSTISVVSRRWTLWSTVTTCKRVSFSEATSFSNSFGSAIWWWASRQTPTMVWSRRFSNSAGRTLVTQLLGRTSSIIPQDPFRTHARAAPRSVAWPSFGARSQAPASNVAIKTLSTELDKSTQDCMWKTNNNTMSRHSERKEEIKEKNLDLLELSE